LDRVIVPWTIRAFQFADPDVGLRTFLTLEESDGRESWMTL
jgi:hypothetical protein